MSDLKWRENLHRTIQEVMYPKKGNDGKFLLKIPAIITDAIDAAYLQGLEDAYKDAEISNGIANSKVH